MSSMSDCQSLSKKKKKQDEEEEEKRIKKRKKIRSKRGSMR
jgi:hypothetical protein